MRTFPSPPTPSEKLIELFSKLNSTQIRILKIAPVEWFTSKSIRTTSVPLCKLSDLGIINIKYNYDLRRNEYHLTDLGRDLKVYINKNYGPKSNLKLKRISQSGRMAYNNRESE